MKKYVQEWTDEAFGIDYQLHKKIVEAGHKVKKIDMPTFVYDRSQKDSITKEFAKRVNRD